MLSELISSMNLIRYLIVWRITGRIVLMPRCVPKEVSDILGRTIAGSLPSQQSRLWKEAIRTTGEWPIETVLFMPYPSGKRAYGEGEVLVWELKLLGNDADHGLFLELILPAMEKLAASMDSTLRGARNLWGRFDIQSLYVARGRRWEPIVSNGKLDIRYRATPTQWAEGLVLGQTHRRVFHSLIWLTPFEFPWIEENDPALNAGPTLKNILNALFIRMTLFLHGKTKEQHVHEVWLQKAWACFPAEEQDRILWALEQEVNRPLSQKKGLDVAPKEWPGKKIGTQVFRNITPPLLPYLELASIVHVGEHTHLGCGTFALV